MVNKLSRVSRSVPAGTACSRRLPMRQWIAGLAWGVDLPQHRFLNPVVDELQIGFVFQQHAQIQYRLQIFKQLFDANIQHQRHIFGAETVAHAGAVIEDMQGFGGQFAHLGAEQFHHRGRHLRVANPLDVPVPVLFGVGIQQILVIQPGQTFADEQRVAFGRWAINSARLAVASSEESRI